MVLAVARRRLQEAQALKDMAVGWDLSGFVSAAGHWPFPPLPPEEALPTDPQFLLRDQAPTARISENLRERKR